MFIPKSITYKKMLFILVIFLLLLTSIRSFWIMSHLPSEQPLAKQGVMDLQDVSFTDEVTINLDGEWEFYPNVFLESDKDAQDEFSKRFLSVPKNWQEEPKKQLDEWNRNGTYKLLVHLPTDANNFFGLRMEEITTAANIYVNGELISQRGNPAQSKENHTGELGATTAFFHTEENLIELVIETSSFDYSKRGGINKSITFGTANAIIQQHTEMRMVQYIVAAILLLHVIYAISFSFIGRQRKKAIMFGLLAFFSMVSVLIDDDRIILSYISIHPGLIYKWMFFAYFMGVISLLLFIDSLFKDMNKKVLRLLILIKVLATLIILIKPEEIFPDFYLLGSLLSLFIYFYLFTCVWKKVIRGNHTAIFILLGLTSIFVNLSWGIAKVYWTDLTFYPFDFIITNIAFACFLFTNHIQILNENESWAKQLTQIDKRRDEFLANTSHELRNPLHGMINIAQSLLDHNQDKMTESNKENVQLLIDIGKRMNFTLNDLSAVTQLKEGKVKLYKKNVNLHMTTALVLDMLDFMKEGKKIRLQSTIPTTFPYVTADENRLIQILFNLVHNAIKFTEKGSITVGANYTGKMATISVKDTGVGIPTDQNIEQVFQSYERVNLNEINDISGIGIGLSVSKQLVELHGGTITYHSTNEGTTFLFTIPLAGKNINMTNQTELIKSESEIAAEKYIEKRLSVKHANENQATILVVDDNPINVKIIKEMLTPQHYVLTSFSAKEALKCLEQNQLDLIISDVMMPNMSGYELTKKIREQYSISELPILLITARNLPEDIHIAFESGANDYLIKPVNSLELKTRVNALTELKQSVKELLRLEAAWLQAQIHPHFLFNTLNSIASLADIDNDRMIALLGAFGNYLQRSFAITNINSVIPIANELELTYSYVHIEKERFRERVYVEFDIDENVDIHIPPLSIQPLVENAIMHGILHKVEGGKVFIRVKKQPHFIEIMIEDDGVGMDQEQIKELLDLRHSAQDGVGVKNTNRRLTQLYGKGLTISSIPNKKTIVRFQIPKES